MRNLLALTCASLALLASPAGAQQSLFSQTPANPQAGFEPAAPAAPAAAAPPAAAMAPAADAPAAAPRPRPKPRGPQAARAITIVNASTAVIASVAITAGDKSVNWAKPIASQAKAVIKLPAIKGCTISLLATYEGEGAGNPGDVDVCKDKTVRLTD
jgi:hypothetical protein